MWSALFKKLGCKIAHHLPLTTETRIEERKHDIKAIFTRSLRGKVKGKER